MRSLENYQIKHLSKYSQLILLDTDAYIRSSCNSIFSTHSLPSGAVTQWFPFLESIFPELLGLQPEDPELRFVKIETPVAEMPGIYDFSFSNTTG